MSKSLGNILDPLELIDEFGADAVRFTLTAMAAMGRDLKLSRDRIAGYRNFGTKLWNAARFAELNDCRPDPAFDPKAVTLTANKWIVGETGRLRETLDAALAAYRFNDAANALYAHVWGKVCDWYVELAKPLFDGDGAAETRATMAWVLDQCLILMHPIMPFITEALWGQIAARAKLLCHADWPGYGDELIDPAADAEMNWVIGLIEEIRSVRAQMHVPAGARVTLVELGRRRRAGWRRWSATGALVARLARVERFEAAAEAPKGAVTLTVQGASFCLPLADVIDIAAERERLGKAIDKLEKEAKGIRGKLANEAFVARAPEEVVDEQRARLEAAEEEIGDPTRRRAPGSRGSDLALKGEAPEEPPPVGQRLPSALDLARERLQQLAPSGLAVGAVVGAVEIGALLGLDQQGAAALRHQLDRGERGGHRHLPGRHPVGEDQALVRHDVEVRRIVDDLGPGAEAEARDLVAAGRGSRPCTRRPPSPRPRRTSGAWPRVSAKARKTRAGGTAYARSSRKVLCTAARVSVCRGHVSSFPSSSGRPPAGRDGARKGGGGLRSRGRAHPCRRVRAGRRGRARSSRSRRCPAASSTARCCMTAASDMSKGLASSPTAAGDWLRRSMIARRVGSASARKRVSTSRCLSMAQSDLRRASHDLRVCGGTAPRCRCRPV